MITLHFFLLILAAVMFLLAAFHVEYERTSFIPLGLFCWLVATLIVVR